MKWKVGKRVRSILYNAMLEEKEIKYFYYVYCDVFFGIFKLYVGATNGYYDEYCFSITFCNKKCECYIKEKTAQGIAQSMNDNPDLYIMKKGDMNIFKRLLWQIVRFLAI